MNISNKQIFSNLEKDLVQIRQICGELCDLHIEEEEGKYFNHTSKKVDCKALFESKLIDKPSDFKSPPAKIPYQLLYEFTYQNRARVRYHYYDDSAGKTHWTHWTQDMIQKYVDLLENDLLKGSYGEESVRDIRHHLKYQHFDVTGHHILVIGTQKPWLEAILLHSGARHITVVDYIKIYADHPNITTLTVEDMSQMYLSNTVPKFDSMITFSSLEHSGLGRYGDSLNPWGDIISMARAWCLLEEGAKALVGVPVGPDTINFNGNRIYGPKMLPHLFANWKQVDTAMDYQKYSTKCIFCYQPIFVLEK